MLDRRMKFSRAPSPPGPPPFLARALALSVGLVSAALVLSTGIVRCPSAWIFGIPCPSCGTTRAARALVALDVAGAFRIHPVAPYVLLVGLAVGLRAVGLTLRTGSWHALGEGRLGRALFGLLVAGACAEVILWVLRWFGYFGGPVAV